MPYIKEESRVFLDECIENTVVKLADGNELSDAEFLSISGELNYTFSRIIAGCMGKPSYSKVAIITGVLENIKQEFYRRVASPYEDKKILENGDIKEYKIL
jgi:hypothetical protein